MGEQQILRSDNDDSVVTINFTNDSPWHVLLLWCDYEIQDGYPSWMLKWFVNLTGQSCAPFIGKVLGLGRRVLYASIGSGRSCQVFSFLSHPWVTVDSKSFLPMTFSIHDQRSSDDFGQITNLPVFIPCERFLNPRDPGAIAVSIHLPMLPLVELCKRTVLMLYSPEIIRRLDLPYFILDSLLQPLAVPWNRLATNRF